MTEFYGVLYFMEYLNDYYQICIPKKGFLSIYLLDLLLNCIVVIKIDYPTKDYFIKLKRGDVTGNFSNKSFKLSITIFIFSWSFL